MWFNIDFNKLVLNHLPVDLRFNKTISYLLALISPLKTVYYNWQLKRDFDWYRLNHTGQRCKLRKVLNDRLDATLRRIYIDDGTSFPREYIYTESENKPKFLGVFYIKTQNEYENTGVDFIVYVPQSIIDTAIYELRYLLNYYKLAGKRYTIQPII